MEWTEAERLKVIKKIVVDMLDLDDPWLRNYKHHLLCLTFICDAPPEFLEENRQNMEYLMKLSDLTLDP